METKVSNTYADNPILYLCFVDYVFCIFRKDVSFKKLNERLNKKHKSIVFTHEIGGEKNAFLNAKFKLKKNNSDEVLDYF